MHERRHALTLIEMLITILVISILAGLVITAIPLAQRAAKRTKTGAIVQAVRVGLGLTAANRGSATAPAPHPLAGSAAPRSHFVRGETLPPLSPGDAVSTAGEALMAANPAWLASSHGSLLLASDRYQGGATASQCENPGLYGLRRDELTILGASSGLIRYRRLPQPAQEQATLLGPYDSSRYPDARFLVRTGGTLADLEGESRTTIAFALAMGSSLAELESLGGLADGGTGDLLLNDRVRAIGPVSPRWKPGHVAVIGGWRPYRLRGQSLVDAWGRELLYRVDDQGAVIIESAGADGVFRVHPGGDGIVQSNADGSLAGDDRDGRRDNVRSGQ